MKVKCPHCKRSHLFHYDALTCCFKWSKPNETPKLKPLHQRGITARSKS